jgi:methionine synthase II (cobalamin-independent)
MGRLSDPPFRTDHVGSLLRPEQLLKARDDHAAGLVTIKRPELEDKDFLKRRIEEASQYVDMGQLCLSGQCGFSSTVEGNRLTHEDQEAKLRLIVEVAEEVWG